MLVVGITGKRKKGIFVNQVNFSVILPDVTGKRNINNFNYACLGHDIEHIPYGYACVYSLLFLGDTAKTNEFSLCKWF